MKVSRYGHDPNDGPGARSSGVTAELGLRNSAVVIDVDREVVRAVLVDAVEGVARFVGLGQSPATALPPFSDPSIGIARALRALEEQTGRQFLAGEQLIHPQRPDGDGADLYLLTGTPAPPNRVALITAGQSPTAAALVAAARRTQTAIAEAGGQGAPGAKTSSLALATWLRGLAPSTVVLVSADGSAEDWRLILEAVAEAARGGSVRQGIVVAGEALQGSAAEVLGSLLELSGIDPTAYGPAEIASAFEAELRQQYAQQVRGTPTLRALTETPFVDRLQATQLAVTFLHRRMGRNVLSVSLGDGTRLQSATRRGALVVSHAEADLGLGARALLAIPPERIVRWLPFRWSPEEITHWVLNRAWRPQTVLEERSDQLLASGLARELLHSVAADGGVSPEVDLIALGPSFAELPAPLALLTVLDGLVPSPPEGVVTVALDREGLLPAAGALATEEPGLAREVIEQDLLSPIATCVVVTGQGVDGALAVRGEVRLPSGESRRFSVPFGSVYRVPLGEGEAASLSLSPEPGFAVGHRPAGEPVTFEGPSALFGGVIGVVIDARGRPISLPAEPEARVARVKVWITDLGGQVE